MSEMSRHAYDQAQVAAGPEANSFLIPRGALALRGSFQQPKLRITMIAHFQNRTGLVSLASFISLALFAVVFPPRALSADAKSVPI